MVNKPIYIFNEDDKNYSIGYLNIGWNIFMILLSCFGIIINLYFGIIYLRRIIVIKRGTSQNKVIVSLIEKILCLISIVESFISIGWLINSLFMYNFGKIESSRKECRILGSFEIFFYLFDWMILSFSLYQIKEMVMDPLHLLQSDLLLVKYIICFAVISLLFAIFYFYLNLTGESPLLTCFIDISKIHVDYSVIKDIMFWIFFTSPIILFGFGFFQIYKMTKSTNFKGDEKQKKFFMKYFAYILIYIIIAFLLITSYLINYIYNKKPEGFMQFYVQIVTILSCSTPLFVGIFRLIKTNLIRKCGKKENDTLNNNLLDKNKNIGDFNEFENDLLRKIIIKYYIAISFVLGKARYFGEEETPDTNIQNNNESNNIINNTNNENNDTNKKDIENIESNENENKNKSIEDNKDNSKENKNQNENNITDEKGNEINEETDNKNDDENNNIKDEDKILKINNDEVKENQINEIGTDSNSNLNLIALTKEEMNLYNETTIYTITKNDILKDLDLSINEDITVLQLSDINITITEYNSQLFKKLREIDDISEDYILDFMKPKYSTTNLMQTYKKNLFYINSTNKEFLLKEISLDELNFYRNNIINNIYQYFKINKNSLILRIKGLYDIILDNDSKSKKQCIALMDNTYESLQKKTEDIDYGVKNNTIEKINKKKGIKMHKLKKNQFTKSLCLYDKVSEKDIQEYSVDLGNIQQNALYRIYLDENEYKRLTKLNKKDTNFLKKIGVLDYSYFIVEIPMEQNDIEAIFNEDEKKNNNIQHIKKYLFKSNKEDNIVYSISIVDYYKDPIKL